VFGFKGKFARSKQKIDLKMKPVSADELRRLTMAPPEIRKIGFPLPLPLFLGWLKTFYANSVEPAVLRKRRTTAEIFLVQRPADDPFYAGKWHLPGAIVLPNTTFRITLRKLMQRELGIVLRGAKELHRFE
jgi:hypothetical protein